jgi:cytochrome c biogenesis protein CcmG, thiol:disulfide interchange protein DsbE
MWIRDCLGTLALTAIVVSGCGGPSTVSAPGDEAVKAAEVNGLARDIDPCPEAVEPNDEGDHGDRLPVDALPCLGTGASMLDLAEAIGRPTLVNLWATWCGPCREEMPALQDAYESHSGEILFVGVNTRDDPGRAADFLQEVGVTYPQVVDGDGQLLDGIGIRGLPVTIVLDASGVVVSQHVGPIEREGIDDLIDRLEE